MRLADGEGDFDRRRVARRRIVPRLAGLGLHGAFGDDAIAAGDEIITGKAHDLFGALFGEGWQVRDDGFFTAALRRRPDRFGAQRRAGKAGDAVEDGKLIARRAWHAIAADGRDSGRCAGHKRGEAGRGLRRKNRYDVVRYGAAVDEFAKIGQFSCAQHFPNECWHDAVPSQDDGLLRALRARRNDQGCVQDDERADQRRD